VLYGTVRSMAMQRVLTLVASCQLCHIDLHHCFIHCTKLGLDMDQSGLISKLITYKVQYSTSKLQMIRLAHDM